ncbi:SDR family oxidoreductase [Mycobacterium sp. CVI_P3]|uniref:SDR family oxidoreductase n=1 Tax=Mycobacterium pinniadriaticum TaxID=2994102 RepID=A0ABT3SP15_9MYCO|nr:SDR family oxidoreductase [Mycobacterium pinniadriaticum]MCX2934852.1 SDR family oxidoreductase [Mycobacterium pinniadriaticum]MCX2941271.1 SDR family oxidoreductase [Mycobacterium pinniadriaticum]
MRSLSGKVVFITGSAGGIGTEVTRLLHGMGAKLVLTDADADALAALSESLGSDDRVLTGVTDVRDLSAMQELAARAVERFGGIDIVLANAGIISFGSVLNLDSAVFKRVLDVDLLGVFHTVRATLPAVVERKGYVLVVSSVAAFGAAPGITPYLAAKAGVEHFANGLRIEVAHQGVDVGLAHMSWVDTPMVREATTELTTFKRMYGSMPGPMGRTVPADQCAAAFVQAMQRRQRHVFCPRWAGIMRWIRPAIASRLAERPLRTIARKFLPVMDAEAAALGRGTSRRVEALEKPQG